MLRRPRLPGVNRAKANGALKSVILAIALLSVSAMTAACTAVVGDSGAPISTEDALSSAKKVNVVGTFVNDGTDADTLGFGAFTFRSDGTYSAQGGCKSGPIGEHCFAIRGTYTMGTSGPQLGAPAGATQLVLTDSLQHESKYFVSVSSDKLSLRTLFRGEASLFTKTTTRSPGEALVGTFTNVSGDPDSLPFYSFTFNSDGTYGAVGGCRPNPDGPSCHAITIRPGTWARITSGPQLGAPTGVPALVLKDTQGDATICFYSIDGKKLSLSTVFRGEPSLFTKED